MLHCEHACQRACLLLQPLYRELCAGAKGRLFATEVADVLPDHPLADFKIGQRVDAVILPDQQHKLYARSTARLNLSMRAERMKAGTAKSAQPQGLQIEELQPGQDVQG